MAAPKQIFLHLGARGELGTGLELMLRRNTETIAASGLVWPSSRLHKPVLRRIMTEDHCPPEADLLAALEVAPETQRLFLSNQHAWASPQAVLQHGEIYQEAEARCAKLATAFPSWKVTLIIEIMPVHILLSRLDNDAVRAELEETDWWQLYEFSWRELALGIRNLAPDTEIRLIPTDLVPLRVLPLMERISGVTYSGRLNNETHLVFADLDPEGRKKLKRLNHDPELKGKHIPLSVLEGLLAEHDARDPEADAAALGIDQEHASLYQARFRDDVEKLRDTAGIVVEV